MSGKNKGAVRKTEEGAKAPDSPAGEVPDEVKADEVKADAPVVETEAEKKAKKALNDKASKAKRDEAAVLALAAELKAEEAKGCFIAPGYSLTSGKGPVVAGDRVTSKHWGKDGEIVLKRLIASGAVLEVK